MDIGVALEEFILNEIMMSDGNTKLDFDESLLAGGVIDSLGILRLVGFMEEKFGVIVEDAEVILDNFETINAMVSLIDRKRQRS